MAKSDRGTIIEWYKDDLENYREKIGRYKRLMATINERIEALTKLEQKEQESKK